MSFKRLSTSCVGNSNKKLKRNDFENEEFAFVILLTLIFWILSR